MKRNEFRCPVCGSENTRKQSEVHADGTSTSTGPKYVITHTTNLADQNQPPPRQRDPKVIKVQAGAVVALTVLVMGIMWVKKGAWPYDIFAGVILLAMGISEVVVRLVYRNDLMSQAYYLQLGYWLVRWRCLDCGSVFVPDGKTA